MRTTIIAASTLALLAGTAHSQVIDWDNSAGGSWNLDTNWSPNTIPSLAAETASIALAGTYTVTINSSIPNLGSLSLTNPDATLGINIARTLGVDAGIANSGLIIVNTTAGAAATTISFDLPGGTLTGTGTVLLNGISTRARIITASGADFVHGVGHTIEGFGQVSADMQNDGLIDANTTGQALAILTGPVFNTGTLQASNGGALDIGALSILQNSTGRIVADGGTVLIGGLTLIDGTIDTINGGTTRVDVASSFDSVTLDGDIEIEIGDTLSVTNGLTNNADLTVNNTSGGAATTLMFDDSSSLGGTGNLVLNGFSTRARLISAADQTITHEAAHTIRGFGRIEADMINNGLIIADVALQEINIINSDIDNTATVSTNSDGRLNIDSTTITNTGAGRIFNDGGDVLFGTSTIVGGTIETVGGGLSLVDNTTTFDAVTIEGPLSVQIGDELTIMNGLTNNGDLTVNNTSGGATTSLTFGDSSSLGGTGNLVLNGFSTRARLVSADDQTITHEAAHTIRGFGRIEADMINNGLIIADVALQEINIINSDIDNTATVSTNSDGRLNIDSTTITNTGAGRIFNDGGDVLFGTSTIVGGTIETVGGGLSLVDNTTTFDAVTIEGPLSVQIGDVLAINNGLTNNGDLTVNDSAGGASTALRFDDSAALTGAGTVTLNGFSTRAQLTGLDGTITVTQGPDHTLAGAGIMGVALSNNGTIAPGFSVGEMEATADITNTGTANYRVEVSAPETADLIDSSASYHADGTITVEYIDGFDPADYWGASVVQADAGVTGRYDTIVAPVPADTRLAVRVRYLPTEIRIGAVCKPDINFDGMLNFFDISAFISLFNAQDPDADIAAPFGAWNFFDIVAYIAQYNAGCP